MSLLRKTKNTKMEETTVALHLTVSLHQLEVESSRKKLPDQIYFQVFDGNKLMTKTKLVKTKGADCVSLQLVVTFVIEKNNDLAIYMLETKKLTKDKLLSTFKIPPIPEINKAIELSIQQEEYSVSNESRILVGSLLVRTQKCDTECELKSRIESDSSGSMEVIERDDLLGSESVTANETLENEPELEDECQVTNITANSDCDEVTRSITDAIEDTSDNDKLNNAQDVNNSDKIIPDPNMTKIGELEKKLSTSLQDLRAINSIQSEKVVQKIKKKVPKFLRKKTIKEDDEDKEIVAEYHIGDAEESTVHVKERSRTKSNYNSILLIKLEMISITSKDSTYSNLTLKVTNGENKYKSQTIKIKDHYAHIEKEISMNIYDYDGDNLEFLLFDGKENVAAGTIKLSEVGRDKYYKRSVVLEQNPSALSSMITSSLETISVATLDVVISKTGQQKTQQQKKTDLDSFKKSGKINLMIVCAHKLKVRQGAIATIKFGNERLETKPGWESGEATIWGDQLIIDIEDSFDFLEIELFASGTKKDFLGRVVLSLHVDLKPNTSYHYYLKDHKGRRLGDSSIEFKIDFRFNKLVAGLKMFQPRGTIVWEEKKEDVSLARIGKLINRIKSSIITPDLDVMMQQVEDILTWKKPLLSVISVFSWLMFVNFFQLWMIPIGAGFGILSLKFVKDVEDEKMEAVKEKKEKKSSSVKDFKLIAESREALRSAQDTLEMIASFLERIKNTFKWKLPFASCVLMTAIFIIGVLLFLLPLRILLSLWGINKICRRLIQPGFINNNEIADFLSRQPSDPQLRQIKNERVEISVK